MFETIGFIVGIAGLAFAILAALYARGLAKKGFRKSGPRPGSAPVGKQAMIEAIEKLGNGKNPFTVSKSEDADLLIEWKIVDAKWKEALGKAWENKVYRAWLALDDKKKRVRCREMIVEKSVAKGGPKIAFSRESFKGLRLWGRENAKRWGIREDYTIGGIYSYNFSPADVKSVVRQVAADNGWSFKITFARPRLKGE